MYISMSKWAIVLPVHTQPVLYDYMTFPFRTFDAKVWLCLSMIILLLFSPSVPWLQLIAERIEMRTHGSMFVTPQCTHVICRLSLNG